ncbi:MAG: TRAP transporter substrate-binding protein [Treponema sp.]|nr:TRAP transporter substrate-binding protein [Treponema sp.]
MKRIISLGLCLFLTAIAVSIFTGCARDEAQFNLTLGSSFARASPQIAATLRFADEVREATNGAVNINVFSDGVIGTERDLILQLAADEVDFAVVGIMPIDMFAPEFGFMSAPFLYRDLEHAQAVFYSHLGDTMRGRFLEHNINLVAEIWRGARHTSSDRAIRTPGDVSGLRIRMTEIPSWVAVWRDGLGAITIPIALGELYTALQTGVVEASEGPYEQLANFRFYEVQRYLINTGHIFDWGGLYASQRLLDRLPREYYEIVVQKAREFITEWGTAFSDEQAQQFRQQLLNGGMQDISIENFADFSDRVMPIYEGFFNDGTWTSSLSEIQSFIR